MVGSPESSPTTAVNSMCAFGGAWQIVMRSPDGTDFRCEGVYSEVVKLERLAFSNDAVDHTGKLLLKGLTSVDFASQGNKTKPHAQDASRRSVPFAPQMIVKAWEQGWSQSFDSPRQAPLPLRGAKRNASAANLRVRGQREGTNLPKAFPRDR